MLDALTETGIKTGVPPTLLRLRIMGSRDGLDAHLKGQELPSVASKPR